MHRYLRVDARIWESLVLLADPCRFAKWRAEVVNRRLVVRYQSRNIGRKLFPALAATRAPPAKVSFKSI